MALLRFLSGTIYGFLFFAVVHCHMTKCTFENSTCQWNLSDGWIRDKGNASNLDTGPKYNHSRNPDGFYLHLNSSHLQPDEKSYIFSPPILDMNKTYCLSFYYLMHGKQVATLSVHVSNGSSKSTEVWATSFEHGPEWLHQEVLIKNGRQVIFEGVFGGELGDIAIDDVDINEGDCLVKGYGSSRFRTLPVNCTFEEKDLCGYHNVRSFRWTRSSGSTSTSNTGPDNDHTLRTKNGHYMYIEASYATRHWTTAQLASPKYKIGSGKICIQFWYNMYGEHIYKLNLYIGKHLKWSRQGSQGYGWKSAFIERSRGKRKFQLKFEVITGRGTRGDVAIDDISIQEGKCPPPVDCSFEHTLCAWSNTGEDAFNWLRRTGKHSSHTVGPNVDHTLGTDKGTYMIIESKTSRRPGDRTRLVSTSITENVKTKCLNFWYNMNGKDVGELLVFISNRTTSTPVWKLIGPQGGVWKFASVPINPRPENFWLTIEGVVGHLSQSYIAFDDISLIDGNCKTNPSQAAIGGKRVTHARSVKPTTPTFITADPRKLILSCNFSNDFCGWTQGKNDKDDWIRTHLATDTFYTGPKRDHTTGKGSYIYVEASNKKIGPIRLFSPKITPIRGNMCLKFWYFMYGRDVKDLLVYIYPGTHFSPDLSPHWKKSGSKPEKWIEGRIFFQMKQAFQIVFEATLNGGVFGDIALDDLSLTYGACNAGEGITTPKPGVTEKPIPIDERNCDFESKDICGYEHIKGSPNYYWIRNSGETSSRNTGPSTDHTTHTSEGFYMYIEGSRHKKGTVARMITPLYQDSTSVCLQFYYHMYGSGIGDFRIHVLPGGNITEGQLIYNTTGDHGMDWAVDRVTIDKLTAAAGYKIMFEATVGKNYRADIALDDVSFTAGECAHLGDCNFEDNSCTWKNVKSDDFDWVLGSGKTPTPQTGPKSDHTLGTVKGHYMYSEISTPIKPGTKALLASALLPKIVNSVCLKFWYNMYGKNMGALKVILQVTGFSKTVLWNLKGQQGQKWLFAQVPLRGTASTYTIFFEASSGASYTGDIAIDDISFTENPCQIIPPKAKITTTTPVHTIPTATTSKPALVRGNFSCNFDRNFCGWKQDLLDSNQWVWQKGPTTTENTGPKNDHTSGKGKYIYLETSKQRPGSIANIISPTYEPDKTGVNCVSFWYHMYGSHVKSLRVFIQYGMALPATPTWSKTGNQGDKWILGQFSFKTNSPFNVVLSATVGRSFDGDIAVDDVTIMNGDCVDYGTNAYVSCDFEKKDLCGFIQGKADTYEWTWHSGETPTSNTGPHNDHTFGTPAGHYVYIKGAQAKGWSRLISPSVHTSYISCVRFYYHMQGSVGQIFAYLSAPNHMSKLWHRKGHQSSAWQRALLEVPNNFTRYEIMFEAFVGGSASGDIAIDDFSITKGKCSDEGRCDFEKGMCIWRNLKRDDFDWIIKKADRNSGTKAPTVDHTKPKSGHFLYVSTDQNPLHTKALIETTDFEQNSKNCLHFFFNAYGKDPGNLTVSLISSDRSRAIWQLIGTDMKQWLKNGQWHEARVKIPKTSRTFTIRMEVVVGRSGYFAIDDIIFDTENNCPRIPSVSGPILTKPPTTIPTTLARTTKPTTPKSRVTSSISCHFSEDFCGWTQDKTDNIDWIRKNGSTPTYATGPSTDHTSKNRSGYFIYIESSFPTKPGDVARIISPKIALKNNEIKCLTFWYNMYGRTIGTLSLLLRVNGKMGAPIWKRQKSQGENWIQGKVNIHGGQSLQVVFEANSGSGYFGDIALDDIWLHGYPCHSIKDVSPLPSCDFEGTCNYKTVPHKYFLPWIITSSTNHPNIADHTYNTTSGEFMYVNMSKVPLHRTARIETPLLKPGKYCLEFFYRSINNFNGYLALRTSSHGAGKTLFYRNSWLINKTNGQWTIAEVNIKQTKPFTVIFETASHRKTWGSLAVDDIVFRHGICPRKGSCDFERGHLCFWTNDPANKVNWEVHTGKTLTRETGPSTDHTKGIETAGTYALLEASHPAKPGDRARLISQRLNNNNVKSCFQFWYSMNGRQVASLSISIKFANKAETRYWLLSGNQGKVWYHGQVPLPPSKEYFRIVIEGSVGGKYGDIGLDDLFVSENGCGLSPRKAMIYFSTTAPPAIITPTNSPIVSGDNTFNCTFEKGTCGWHQSKTDNFDWTRNKGYTPSRATGPLGDHTTGRGYYMYIEASGSPNLKKAELVFEANDEKPGFKCMRFWYSMRGSNVGSLNIYIITDVDEQPPVWTKSGTQGATWNSANIEFNANATFKVRIEGVKGHGRLGDIALDDITLQNGGCREPYGDCDFETNDRCGYTNDPTGDFKWRVRHGNTDTRQTGPKADHTYGTFKGHYMYIESSYPRKQNDTARLISPVYKAVPDEHCLQFYSNMYGEDIGALNVKIRVHDLDNTTYDTDNYLQITNDQGNDWFLAQVEIPKLVVENPYQLIFEGVIGKGWRGDIAIDDIVINYGQCEIGGDCDFDSGRCTWENANRGDDFDWMVGSGKTSTPETGPLTDHTQQNANGFYIFIDASFPKVSGKKAWYVSQIFTPTFGENRCITFWYSMNGLGVGTLRVIIKFETGGNNTLWELSKDQGNDWQFGQAPIKSPTPYKIIFEAVRGSDDRGDIALDDILFTDFFCSVKPEIATPRGRMQTLPSLTGTTPATNGFQKSLNCTFDLGMCGWTQDTKDDFDWAENNGPSIVWGTGPRRDHNSNGTGFYLYIPTIKRRANRKARLISPLLRPKGLQCFTVWYHMFGSDVTTFNVYIFTGPRLPSPALHLRGTKKNKWLRGDIQFNSKSPYNVILEGFGSWGTKGQIAVDDVSLVDGHCPTASLGKAKFCNFETGDICGFRQDRDDDLDWYRNRYRGQVNIPDHTYGSKSGHFMFVRRSRAESPNQYASLSTLVDTVNSTDLCVDFWYYMSGGYGTGTLALSYLTNNDNFQKSTTIFSIQDGQEKRWLQAMSDIDVSKADKVQIKFFGITGQSAYRLIGLDDVKISPTSCKRRTGDCNFETDMCNWMNRDKDDFDWTIGSGFTTTTKSGPVNDHTRRTQAGSYLYIEPESTFVYGDDSNSGKFALLESETFQQSQQFSCFQFYYYMKEAKDGFLEVNIHPVGSEKMTPLWHLEGHQSENWTLAQMRLPAVAPTYQVIIKGGRGPRFEGQIAIDDLSFSKSFPCNKLPTKAKINPITTTPIPTTPIPIVGFDCTFDRGYCSWTHDTHSKYAWSRRRGSNKGPASDHTGGGLFLFVDTSRMVYRKEATLISPNISVTTQRCLSFYYYVAGEDDNTLQVGFKNVDGLKILWRREGPQGDQWNHASVNLPTVSGNQKGNVLLTGIGPKVGASGFMAIDDITLYTGQCKPPENSSKFDCDFESSKICGYTQEKRVNFNWIRGSGENKVKNNQPDVDHTYGTGHGHYMYLNSSNGMTGQNAILWTPKFKAEKDSCLKFWYRMSGSLIGKLKVRFATVKNARYGSQIVWMRRGAQGDNWNPEFVNINQNHDFYVLFEGEAGINPGGIAIDDVKVMPTCEEPADCTFEIDSCGWHNAKHNDLYWQRLNIRHITYYRRLPGSDHTKTGKFGHYMFFTSRYYVNPGKKADLVSVSYDPTSEKGLCFEFWFIISGYNYGSLMVFKQSKSTNRTMLWKLSKTNGRMWTRASFHVKSSEPYEIIFRALKGNGGLGYIAIDDINYSAVTCKVTPINARVFIPSTKPSVKTTPPGPTVQHSPYDCTFENGFCQWTQAKDDDFDWLIGTGHTKTEDTGPEDDHTLGTPDGHFMYIESSKPRKPNDTARLVSPVIKRFAQVCVSFWYHMYGQDINSLNVYFINDLSKKKKLLWSRTGTLNRKWYQGSSAIIVRYKTQIIIEATRGQYYKGDIAVDDIRIVGGACPEKQNICDFEDGDICRYKQAGSDQFDWSVGTPASQLYLPKTDHTQQSSSGKFLYVNGNHRVNTTAQILGPVMKMTYGTCIRFWYNLNDTIALNVYSVSAGERKMLNTFQEDTKSKWLSGIVNIKSYSTWEVMFEAQIKAKSTTSYLALDDISTHFSTCGMTGDCTFEYDMCYWQNEKNRRRDNFDWIIKKAGTGVTGPNTDHTLQNSEGSYLFIEGSEPQKSGDTAVINGPRFYSHASRRCLKFWYNIHGGQLEIGFSSSYKGLIGLWRVFGSHGEPGDWKLAQVPLPLSIMGRRILIRGTIGTGSKSFIALDDLTFHSSSCTRVPAESDPRYTTPAPMSTPATRPPFVPHSIYDCSFEKNFCSWKNQPEGDQFDWIRAQGPTQTSFTGPDTDHTLGTAKGWYIYIETSSKDIGEVATLVSKPFKNNTEYCFMFYYHMFGTSFGKLDVILNSQKGSNLTLWTKSKNHGQIWLKESFRIPKQQSGFTISFRGEVGSDIHGDIALDDVRAQEGECPESGPLNCTFESVHICGFTTPENHGVKWDRHYMGHKSRYGPRRDHTLSTYDGTYMFLELIASDQKSGQAQLVSPVIKRSPDLCMSFYYQMGGNSEGYLGVYQQIENTRSDSPIWIDWRIKPTYWTKGQVTLPAHDNYKVIFEGKLDNKKSSLIIDDISTVPGVCPEPGNCNFERNTCNWKPLKGEKYWRRSRGESPTPSTGPTTDHTTGKDTGYYMYIEASYSNPHDSARLRSISFPPTTARCMRFWYHMFGKHMGRLRIYFVDEKTNQNKTAIWDLEGNQGNKWRYAQVAFAWSDIYYIIIEGTVGVNILSDIAIDDITFTSDYCAVLPITADTNYHFPNQKTTTPTPTQSASFFDCDFEYGMCNWKQGRDDEFDWRLNFGRTPSRRTGPQTDHTFGTKKGHYIYIETTSRQRENDRAQLESPAIVPSQTGCLKFWYFMYGPDVATLNVYIKFKKNLTAVWTRTGTIDPAWHQAMVPINSQNNIQIVIEALKGRRYVGDIAIDDITFSYNGCTGSADMTCGFEDSKMCGFIQSKEDNFDWRWFQARQYFVNRQKDHTSGTAEGHYMLVSGSDHKPGENAIIISPSYTSKISKCVEFWYYMSRENSGSLNVYSSMNGTRMKLWSRNGNQGSVWSLAQMTVTRSGIFNLVIEAVTETTAVDISIDDFGLFEGDCPKPGNCDFEKGWCTWNNNRTDDFDWQIGTGYLGMFGAPHQDHTTDSISGHFLFLQSSFQLRKGSRAVLFSEVFDGTYHNCMTFWYHMRGPGTGTLNIYTVTSESKKLSWTLTGDQPFIYWSYGQFPVHHKNQAFKILIEGINGESNQINIAIDDIFFTDENCGWSPRSATTLPPTKMTTPMLPSTTMMPTPVPTKFDCTFEKDMCQWKQDKNDTFDWLRSQGPMGSNVTGPIIDHTRGNDDGWYVFTDISDPREPFDVGRLIGPIIPATQDRCFNFWYHMHGSYVSSLSVILSVNGNKETRWTKSGDQGDAWREAAFNLAANSNTNYQIIFEGSRSVLTNGEIAIDDIRFTKNKCHADNPTYCDFEDGFCKYTQMKTDDFDWKRKTGKTPTLETGPSIDHTTGTQYGHYIYIETSGKKANQKAQLISVEYNSTITKCLHFYYHMYGDNIDQLNVYKVDATHLTEMGSPVWSRKYNQGKDWLEGQATISSGDNYHIIFEGKVGRGEKGDIAIDDIYLTPGACQPPGFCDFEKDLCTWKNIKSDQFDWLRSKGYSDTPTTGPSADHTLGTTEGYYVYIDTSDPQAPGDVSRLQSENFPSSNMSLCLRFWYQMNGKDVNSLNVLVKNENGEGYLWTQSGNNGPEWLYGQLNVDSIYTNKPYSLLFEGVRGEGYNGDIALDDIEVSQGECAIMPEYADTKALALTKVGCNFDVQDTCEWQQSRKDDEDWKLLKGSTGLLNTGPKADHSGSGYYIFTRSSGFKKGIRAVLKTPKLGPTTGKGNCFTFYYYMYGMQIGTLNIYTVVNQTKTLRWTKSGEQGNNWKHAHLNINSKFNYQIYIESITSGHYYDVIALDDLAMVGNPCPAARVCDFNLDLCGWTPVKSYKEWLHAMKPTPIADHTTGTKTAGLIYTNSSLAKTPTKFRISTPFYPPATKSCLKFWYNMESSNPGTLRIYVKLPYTEWKIWEREGDQGNFWWQGHVDVGRPTVSIIQPYQLIFETEQDSSNNGIIAIDDVEHLPGPCFNNGICDFEQDFCGFSNVKGDDFDWIRGQGRTISPETGPLADHTLQSPRGHYMFIEATGIKANQNALFASWVHEKTTGTCFKFWYNMHGMGMGKLNIYMWSHNKAKRLWSKSGDQGQDWLSASITVVSTDPFSVVFEGVRGPTQASDIAIDDVLFLDGSCETQTTPSVGIITQPPTLESMFHCDFELNFCGWKQDTSENADWTLATGSSATGGPRSDHTKDNNMGGYIWLESSKMTFERTARLMSDFIEQTRPVCLTFWYHMGGETPGTLNVYVKNIGEKKSPVWTKYGTHGMNWRYAEVEIAKPEKGNKIYFEAIRGSGYGDISLDDIILLLDKCPPRDFCDFEEPDICGYEQGDTDVFDWTWGSGQTPTSNTGPNNDHTYGTKYGHYMYIEISRKARNDHAHLYSPVYPATTSERCLAFWYNMNGKDVARLSVYLYQNNQLGDQIWSLQMDQGRHWHLATVPVNSETPFQILFEGIREKGEYGDIAIDDVKLSKEACDPVAFCTFEEGICGWENIRGVGGANHNWRRMEASSVRKIGGPSIDHTIGDQSGFFMFVNPIHWRKGETAQLKSQTIPLLANSPKSYCFHFWYNVQGKDIGELYVNITYHGDTPETFWSLPESHKSKWSHGTVFINEPYSHFEIVLTAVGGTGNNGYIAIDDLQLQPGTCPNTMTPQYTCRSGKKISSSKVCNFLKDCPDSDDEQNCGGCTFEKDMCTWKDRSVGMYNWTRLEGKSNKKWFVHMEHKSDKGYGTEAVLQNRALQQTSSTCQLKFSYYLTGTKKVSLSVAVLEGGRVTELFRKSYDRGPQWHTAIGDIGKISRPFKLQFIAHSSYTGHDNIGVDDIEFLNCNFPDPEEQCASTEFQCKSKGCVDKSRICDLSDDCGDGSDEINCQNFTTCDFETSLCTWSQDTSDDFDWTRMNEATETVESGPTRDHSKGTGSGYYIYAEASPPRKKGDKTRLLSAVIQPSKDCWLRFFYHMKGYKMGSLNVYTRTSILGAYNKVWTKYGHLGDLWEKADVKVSSDHNFQIVFEAEINGYSSDMALDDITLTPGCHLADPKVKLPDGTKTKPTPNPCGSGLFKCKTSGCVLQSEVCDFNNHCDDGSDEDICATCNFETGICGWKERSTGRFKWQSHQGDSPGKFGPLHDHTSKSDIGKYMMVLGAYGIYRTNALLESRPLGATVPTCRAEFYVFMSGKGVGNITLNIIDPIAHKVRKRVASVIGDQGEKWKRIVGDIGAQPAGFALQFSASPNAKHHAIASSTDMAIDDVKMINCNQPISTKQPSTKSVTITTMKAHPKTTSHTTRNVLPAGKSTTNKAVASTTNKAVASTTNKAVASTTNKAVASTPSKAVTSTPSKAVTSTSKGPEVCGENSFSCPTATNLCFPLVLLCDGHADCPDNYDEKNCRTCPKGQTYCIPKQQCIVSHRCDGISDCPDGSDESACNECPDGFCLNGGTCITDNGFPECQCKDKDTNFRCLPQKLKSKSKKVWVIPVGVILALIITAVLCSVIYFFWIRKSDSYTPSQDVGIANPAYDYGTTLPTDFPMLDLEPAFNDGTASQPPSNPTSIENPLYGYEGKIEEPGSPSGKLG